MEHMTTTERTLTELDHARVAKLLRVGCGVPRVRSGDGIEDVLEKSDLVSSDAVTPDLVTMNSRFSLRDLDTGERYQWTLCYPSRADFRAGFISVLSPAGSGLLGRRVGSVARWKTPGGADKTAEVMSIYFQPEASGDYVL